MEHVMAQLDDQCRESPECRLPDGHVGRCEATHGPVESVLKLTES